MGRTGTGIYGGATAEQRRDERRAKLMQAALEIIGADGWTAMTVRGVCERARVGPRFFYESFPDLEALAVAVLDETVAAALARTRAALSAAPADDLMAKTRAAIATIVTELTDDPHRARLVFAEAHGGTALTQRRFAAMRAIAALVVEEGRGLVDADETALHAVSLLMTGGVAELVIVWIDGGLDMTREQVIETCIAFVLATVASFPRVP